MFGSRGWFGTAGLGDPAAHALIVIEDRRGELVPAELFRERLGRGANRALEMLSKHGLIVSNGATYSRGPATLVDVARSLRTLGTRTWRRVRHADERERQRAALAKRGDRPRPGFPADDARTYVLRRPIDNRVALADERTIADVARLFGARIAQDDGGDLRPARSVFPITARGNGRITAGVSNLGGRGRPGNQLHGESGLPAASLPGWEQSQ